jgi:hypothetical protein
MPIDINCTLLNLLWPASVMNRPMMEDAGSGVIAKAECHVTFTGLVIYHSLKQRVIIGFGNRLCFCTT